MENKTVTEKNKKIPVNVSFSVKHDQLHILEKFNEKISSGMMNRSAVFLQLMDEYNNSDESCVLKMFKNYCAENHLSADAQLKLLMGPYRVSNDGGAGFWEKDTEVKDILQRARDDR